MVTSGTRPSRGITLLARAILLVLALVVVLPLLWMVSNSLKRNHEFILDPFGLPHGLQWSNYADAWQFGVRDYVTNSLIVTIASVILTTLLSAWAAFGLTKTKIPLPRTLLLLILGGLMLTPTVAVVPLLGILQNLGIFDSLAALIILYTAFRIPFTTFVIRSYMIGLPREVDEAAVLDGCSRSQHFWRVIFPMSTPIVTAAVLLQFLFAWNEYLFAFIFISSPGTMTLPVGLANLAAKLSTNYPMIFAGMTLASVPMFVIFFLSQRFFVRGIADGVGK